MKHRKRHLFFVLILTGLWTLGCAEESANDPTDTQTSSDTYADTENVDIVTPTDIGGEKDSTEFPPLNDTLTEDMEAPSDSVEETTDILTEDTPSPGPDILTPSDVCETAGDCTLSEFDWLVTSPSQCFCPQCPTNAVTVSEHEARLAAWTEHCDNWADAMNCPQADCIHSVELVCVDGACGIANPAPNVCDTNVECDLPPLECGEGLIPVNKNGCWGCAHPETCTCSDGTELECDSKIPECNGKQELAIIDGCHLCVDAITCSGKIPPKPDGCIDDDECTFTEYLAVLNGPEGCYCPKCPAFPTTLSDHEERKASWNLYCTDWAIDFECPESPPCPIPGTAICEEGICIAEEEVVLPPSPCDIDVSCNEPPPECPFILVPVNKDGCWGCGFPETCSCSDGEPIICDMVPPTCPPDQELADKNGCYLCVDPITCKPPIPTPPFPDPKICITEEDCTMTPFESVVTSEEECACPQCPIWPVTVAEHELRSLAWDAVCGEWAEENPCMPVPCVEPPKPYCEEGICLDGKTEPPLVPIGCDTDVECDGPMIECSEGLIPVNKDGCWGCAFPNTCTCNDGLPGTCNIPIPICPEGTQNAKQNGCYECVDPITCIPPI